MAAPVWTFDEFTALRDRVAQNLVPMTADIVGRVEKALSAAQEVQLLLPAEPPAAQTDAITDLRTQLDRLLPPGFVTATGRAHLGDLTRYLTASRRRLERLPYALEADRARMQRCTPCRTPTTNCCGAARDTGGSRRCPGHRASDRGAASEPVGPAARHPAGGQRAADLSRHRRRVVSAAVM
ncbi:hypothetical protein NIIDMKKI_32410 [Mycobacterium kansasii]|uniref:RNA helicase HrpA C-terminal domain-containing protein n=1 Tax=Mycobacterium kansasii TaxID=1768 RepID=A0A7G1IE41_MYCKA|nr:hypothetical protein NIIDMKKI_32410 [Mycobacterium kansasii]